MHHNMSHTSIAAAAITVFNCKLHISGNSSFDDGGAAVKASHLQDISEELERNALSQGNLLCGSVSSHDRPSLGILHHQKQLVCLRVVCMTRKAA